MRYDGTPGHSCLPRERVTAMLRHVIDYATLRYAAMIISIIAPRARRCVTR